MKNLFVFTLFAIFCLSACAPYKSTAKLETREEGEMVLADNEVNTLNPLESYLLRTPGVNIVGSGASTKVHVRGVSSFNSGTEPLFLVNGTDVGTSYVNAAYLVADMKITSVRVLKGPDASLYGVRGGNGVIVIKAK